MQSSNLSEAAAGGKSGMLRGLATKVICLVAICHACLVLTVATSLWQMAEIGSLIDDLAQRDVPLTTAVIGIKTKQLEQSVHLERSLLAGLKQLEGRKAREDFQHARTAFLTNAMEVHMEISRARELAGAIGNRAVDDAARWEIEKTYQSLGAAAEIHRTYNEHALKLFDLIETGKLTDALAEHQEIAVREDSLNQAFDAIAQTLSAFTLEGARAALASRQRAVTAAMVVFTIIFAFSLGLAVLLTQRGIMRPLGDLFSVTGPWTPGAHSVDMPATPRTTSART